MEIVNRFRKALGGLKQMSVEFLVPAKWLTVSGTAVKTRTYKLTPDFQPLPFLRPRSQRHISRHSRQGLQRE
jgi:hypothetical protein